MAYTQPLTTIVPDTRQRLPDGRWHVQIQFAGDAGEQIVKREIQHHTDDELKARAKAIRDELNGSATLDSGAIPDPTPAVNPAGVLADWIADVHEILRLSSLRTSMDAVTPPVGDPATRWGQIKGGLDTRIAELVTGVTTTWFNASLAQKKAGVDHL